MYHVIGYKKASKAKGSPRRRPRATTVTSYIPLVTHISIAHSNQLCISKLRIRSLKTIRNLLYILVQDNIVWGKWSLKIKCLCVLYIMYDSSNNLLLRKGWSVCAFFSICPMSMEEIGAWRLVDVYLQRLSNISKGCCITFLQTKL